MKTDRDIHRGDLDITENTTLTGLVMGSVTVQAGVLLVVQGSVAVDVILNENSKLEHYGRIGGDIVCRAGHIVHCEGKVSGNVVQAGIRKPGAG